MTLPDMPRSRIIIAMLALVAIAMSAASASAERPNAPMWCLAQAPFQLEVTVLSVELKQQDSRTTNVWHRVRVERVSAGSGLKVGDETAVVSQVFDNPLGTTGQRGDRGPSKGPHGPHGKGPRARHCADGTAKTPKG